LTNTNKELASIIQALPPDHTAAILKPKKAWYPEEHSPSLFKPNLSKGSYRTLQARKEAAKCY